MLSHCNADPRKMIFKTEIDTRTSIRREWEELRNQILQTTALSRSIGHGDANTWILELNDPNTREKAMQNLCSHHRNVPDLGVLLWYSFGAVSSLIQEVMVAYLKPNIDKMEGMRIVLALSLLERIAEHPRSRIMFVCSKLHEIVAPLARVGPVSAPAETFRRGALQVIAALFNTENWDRAIIAEKEYGYVAVQFLVDDYLFSVIWNSAKHGQVVSQTVVIQILAKIISNDELFTIFSRKTNALKNLYCALEHMHSCFRLNLPGLCPLVESLYERVERRRLSSSLPKVSTPIGSEMSSIRRLRQSLA